jgi:hypothetical protein
MWNLYWSPFRFFDARRHRDPHWVTALSAPALCAVLQGVSVAMFTSKTRPALEAALARLDLPLTGLPAGGLFAAASVLAFPMFFCLLSLAVLALDVVVHDSGQPARLTEYTALSFYTQVPYCLVMIAIAWVWVPEAFSLPAGASTAELIIQVQRYRASMVAGPLLSTGRLLSYYSMFWLAAVLGIALMVVGGRSARAAVVMTIVLFSVCAAGPILITLLP